MTRQQESEIQRIMSEAQEENEKKWGRPSVREFTLAGIDLGPMYDDFIALYSERFRWHCLEQMQDMIGAKCFEGMLG